MSLFYRMKSSMERNTIVNIFLQNIDNYRAILFLVALHSYIRPRRVKNTCRTATSLAKSRGQKLQYEHLEEALNAMEEFVVEFASMKA